MSATAHCTSVSEACPVTATIYGYQPSIGANAFFIALFGVLLACQLVLGAWKRTWSFTIAISIGCFGEFIGYIGRILLHNNPWSQSALSLQLCCLILAPSFMAAGVYLTLKHITTCCGAQHSLLRPKRYPWIFVLCDLCSIAIQAIGGGIAATAGSGTSQAFLTAGSDLIVAGIAFQVATMVVFCGFVIDYCLRRQRSETAMARTCRSSDIHFKEHSSQEESVGSIRKAASVKTTPHFRLFCTAIGFAYVTILIRCIYRIHEMAGGWGNPAMRDETTFLVLDGTMIALAGIAFTFVHPGIFFPRMCAK